MDALDALAPVSSSYASLPVDRAFNWAEASQAMPVGEWYMVAFRSRRKDGADEVRLTRYDDRAQAEAEGAPGFVHYFKGPTGPDGSCMSFCLWTGRPEARAAAGRPDHAEAVTIVGEMYERYTLEFYRVRRTAAGSPLEFATYDPGLAA